MGQEIYAVRIGDKYGPEFEKYHESKLGPINWIREPFDSRVALQWNKLFAMKAKTKDPVVVIDIDMLWLNDYMDIINTPIEPGEFLTLKAWWQESDNPKYFVQGGFQKYYPKDCRQIVQEFMFDPHYWQQHYIKNGTTIGPVNGEQYFIQDMVEKNGLKLKFIPQEWITKWHVDAHADYIAEANLMYPGDYVFCNNEFNPQIRLVHLQGLQDPLEVYQTMQRY